MSGIGRSLLNKTRSFLVWSSSIVGGGLTLLYIDQHVGGVRRIEGPSMSPTLNFKECSTEKIQETFQFSLSGTPMTTPDCVIFSRNFDLGRGDVVILDDPKSPNNFLCKRVIGIEGDSVTPLGYNQEKKESIVLKKGEVWVESDAGFGYKDSNFFGPVRASSIQGKVNWATKFYPHELWSSTRRITSEIPSEAATRLKISH